jgi:hypothetical protein
MSTGEMSDREFPRRKDELIDLYRVQMGHIIRCAITACGTADKMTAQQLARRVRLVSRVVEQLNWHPRSMYPWDGADTSPYDISARRAEPTP